MVEPVFLLRRELPPENGTRYDTLEVCLAAEKVSGSETVLGSAGLRQEPFSFERTGRC